ncbi:cysteine peptidase family C39 domain-containing protein [uncultured Duncaniella sp.]|uniref:cysteine peptidase family C39 domain-containing protein n=1 Tax=uncultured Duncaniella sp. TaxID=2768039 RepID=UPI0034223D11
MSRFRLIKQHDGMQCGVACVSMICSHYDNRFSIQRLEDYCHASKEGVSLKAIHNTHFWGLWGWERICKFAKIYITHSRNAQIFTLFPLVVCGRSQLCWHAAYCHRADFLSTIH